MTSRALRPPFDLSAYAAPIALVALVAVNAALTPGFVSFATASNVSVQVSTTVLVAIGMTLVIATGGIDLSVGAVMAVSSVVCVSWLRHGALLASVLSLLAGSAFGLANGVLVGRYQILPIIVTLAGLIMGRGIAQVVVEGNPVVAFSAPGFERLGKGTVASIPIPVLVSVGLLAAGLFVVRQTVIGRWVVATGGNERAARLSGVPVVAVRVAVYTISGFLAGLAGLIETARLAATDAGKIGLGIELDAIVAVVVGGTSLSGGQASLGGTVVGAVIMGVLNASLNMHLVAPAWSLVIKAAILIAAVWLQRRKRA